MGAALYKVIAWPKSKDGAMAVLMLGMAVLMALPILASLALTAGAALGHFPALGAYGPTRAAFGQLLAMPGLATATWLALTTGVGAAVLSLGIALAMAAVWGGHPALARALAPFLAIPHAALAVGLAFLLAPSGWIARALAPMAGWVQPPDLASVGDAGGLALMLGLTIKETPFLLLMILTALRQIPLRTQMQTGVSLGYGRGAVWLLVIMPQIWPLIRLPFCIVLVYGLSVIDMALILGPTTPPTLAVWVMRLYASPDVMRLLPASAGAMMILAMAAAVLLAGLLCQRGAGVLARLWRQTGRRGGHLDAPIWAMAHIGAMILVLGALAMLSLGLWSLAWRWPWPDLWPADWTLAAWQIGGASWGQALQNTLTIAAASTALSVILAIAWFEIAPPAARALERLIVLPLLIPQIALLFGMNILLVRLGLGGTWGGVIWGHALFVFPYVMLALSAPWRAHDPRFDRTAQSLGAGAWARFWRIKLPILLAPICTAAAIGVAVSVAQYLPTVFLGAGRWPTLTTEAVTLASSSNRRVTGVVATLQAGLPLLAYLSAVMIPAYLYRNRRDLSGKAGP